MSDKLAGKIAVITGAASGIGAETARLFVENGAKVVIADMQVEKGEAVAAALGQSAIFCPVNVVDEPDIASMVAAAVSQWGGLDILFNNAGFGGALGPVETTSVEEYDVTFNVLVRGVFLGMKHAAPVMKAQNSGVIINTASIAGMMSGVSPHLYGAAKAAVIKLTESVALELAEQNIRVNAICPGLVATPLTVGRADATEADVDALRQRAQGGQPLGRSGVPRDIANAALFLASDDSNYITGHALVVDGGLKAGPSWRNWPDYMRTHHELRLYHPDN